MLSNIWVIYNKDKSGVIMKYPISETSERQIIQNISNTQMIRAIRTATVWVIDWILDLISEQKQNNIMNLIE